MAKNTKEFNRNEYIAAAKAAGVYYKGTVCAVVEDGEVVWHRDEVRLAIYLHLGYEVPDKYEGVEPAELDFSGAEVKKTKTTKKAETAKAAPKNTRLDAIESRVDSLEASLKDVGSKLDAILSKLG